MADVFEGRSISTRFRILVEIASRQPSVQQKDVAEELGITVQAVSEHMKELIQAGCVVSHGRTRYSVTPQGVDWLLRTARGLQKYSERVSGVVRDIAVTAALAGDDLDAGQTVALMMQDGLLWARPQRDGDPARGTVVGRAAAGMDVGLTGIEGVIPLSPGEVLVATMPAVQDGGSLRVDGEKLRALVSRVNVVAAAGIEALVALRSSGREPDCWWASSSAVVEAASSGVSCLLVCPETELSRVSGRLKDSGIAFSVVDVSAGLTQGD
ncbi:MAG: winged helix-turn-helix transcriptional regulator [Chloroflexi bacterium]|nr:winged helix-turn-helix transcriptional regulator [Chloroflexota bacterium]